MCLEVCSIRPGLTMRRHQRFDFFWRHDSRHGRGVFQQEPSIANILATKQQAVSAKRAFHKESYLTLMSVESPDRCQP